MAVIKTWNTAERGNISDRIGLIFDLPAAGHKISEEGWTLESIDQDRVLLKVELVATISREEAEAILNARPVSDDTPT